ncbi:MAG TPA: glycosyltransferase family 4 protein, partial [Thermoanaerobaculia bacterium]|nr:glycosyltransferase family 4 protein [Thermoanaerobaculia bacterium]
ADPGPEPARTRSLERIRAKGRIDALFVGKSWLGKGGPVAMDTCAALRERGHKVHLHIAGCRPPGIGGETTTVHGFLDMREEEDRAELDRLYRDCDLLLFPSTYEGFGIAPLEAAAYGMPTAGAGAIGLDTSIRHGLSGALLPAEANGEDYAEAIDTWFREPRVYDELVEGARALFAEELNWSRSAHLLIEAIEGLDAFRREA